MLLSIGGLEVGWGLGWIRFDLVTRRLRKTYNSVLCLCIHGFIWDIPSLCIHGFIWDKKFDIEVTVYKEQYYVSTRILLETGFLQPELRNAWKFWFFILLNGNLEFGFNLFIIQQISKLIITFLNLTRFNHKFFQTRLW